MQLRNSMGEKAIDHKAICEKVIRHRAVCDELNDQYARWSHEHGDKFHEAFAESGLGDPRMYSRFTNLAYKLEKLCQRASADGGRQKATDGSVRETLISMAAYAIATVLEIDEAEG